MELEHSGVVAKIPEEMLADARDCMRIDIPMLLRAAIDRMLYVSKRGKGDFEVSMQIQNPSCEAQSCDFTFGSLVWPIDL